MNQQWLAWYVLAEERPALLRRLKKSTQFSRVRTVNDWLVASAELPKCRIPVNLNRGLAEEFGYLFSYCDSTQWGRISPDRVQRLLRGSPEHLDQLPGDFSFAYLQATGEAQVVRSCGGLGPWHVYNSDGRIALATRLDWIALTQPRPIELDLLSCATRAIAFPTALAPRSPLKGTLSLPAGHRMTISPHRQSQLLKYFKPEPLRLAPPSRDHQRYVGERLRELVLNKLASELAVAENLLLYSGGLDSSLLAGAAESLGIKLHATTLLPGTSDPTFPREKQFTDLLSQNFLTHTRFQASTLARLNGLVHCEGLIPMGSFWGLVGHTRKQRPVLSAALSGYLADECFGVVRAADWINATPPLGVFDLLRSQPRDFPVGGWWLKRQLGRRHALFLPARIPELFGSGLKEEYQEFYAEQVRCTMSEPCAFRLSLILRYADYSGIYAEACAVQGLRAVLPYAQREVIELAYATHPREFFDRGLAKMPLRIAAEGLLPQSLTRREDMGNWSDSDWEIPPPLALASESSAPFVDRAWLAQQPALDLFEAGALMYVQQMEEARKRLSYEQNAFFRA